MMISVRRSAGSSRGQRGSTPSSRLRSLASRMARNLRLIESLWRYGIGGNLARFGGNLTRSAYLTLCRIELSHAFLLYLPYFLRRLRYTVLCIPALTDRYVRASVASGLAPIAHACRRCVTGTARAGMC